VFFAVYILDEPSAFYAEEIHEAVSDEVTNDRKLMQIFLKRAEVFHKALQLMSSQTGVDVF
jgi:hypothetical protein